MAINVGALALIGALGLGAGATYQYDMLPSGPTTPAETENSEMSVPPEGTTSTTDSTTEGMSVECQTLQTHHQQMMTAMEESDKRLEELGATMRNATGDAKTEATAAVVDALLTERKQMREHFVTMHRSALSLLTRPNGSTDLGTCVNSMFEHDNDMMPNPETMTPPEDNLKPLDGQQPDSSQQPGGSQPPLQDYPRDPRR